MYDNYVVSRRVWPFACINHETFTFLNMGQCVITLLSSHLSRKVCYCSKGAFLVQLKTLKKS